MVKEGGGINATNQNIETYDFKKNINLNLEMVKAAAHTGSVQALQLKPMSTDLNRLLELSYARPVLFPYG